MSEHTTKFQSNLNWGETFRMVKKAPAVANRIFATLNDAQAYVDNLLDSATEGIRITVLNDVDENNGVYYVKSIGDGNEVFGELVKICRGNVAWFKGNAVSADGDTFNLKTANVGDMYMNTDTLDMFMLTDGNVWRKIGNMMADTVDRHAPYYILSVSGTEHPEFSLDTWTKGNEDGSNIPCNYSDYEAGQLYLWTRIYDSDGEELLPKYTVALVYSSINLGVFNLN